MIVPLDSIPTRGLIIKLGDWARVGAAQGLGGPVTDLAGELRVARLGRHLVIRGEIAGAAGVPCDRCGEPLPLLVSADVNCLYSPIDTVPERAAGDDADEPAAPIEVDPPVAEYGEFDGVSIDLAGVVLETFCVERPVRWRCDDVEPSESGPCIERWRRAAGTPDSVSVDPRFSVLSQLKPSR